MRIALVYIAGYGRSGSTLLEGIMSCQPGMVALGEVSFLMSHWQDNAAACACQANIGTCSFWSPICKRFLSEVAMAPGDIYKLQQKVEACRTRRLMHLKPWATTSDIKRYQVVMTRLYDAIKDSCPPGTTHLIDSSKTAYTSAMKPQHLLQNRAVDLYVIHLIRDLRGVIWSIVFRGLNRRLDQKLSSKASMPGARAIVGWIAANRAADRLRLLLPIARYYRLRYEDLVSKPEAVLKNLGAFLGVDFSGVAQKIDEGIIPPLRHQVGGNRMRKEQRLLLRPDFQWRIRLQRRYRIAARILAGSRLQFYGYESVFDDEERK